MIESYSIAEARNQFAALVRQIEEQSTQVQITRRGQPVAVILSKQAYEQLLAFRPEQNFWQAYQEWRQKWQGDDWEDEDIFAGIRDPSPGREVALWD